MLIADLNYLEDLSETSEISGAKWKPGKFIKKLNLSKISVAQIAAPIAIAINIGSGSASASANVIQSVSIDVDQDN